MSYELSAVSCRAVYLRYQELTEQILETSDCERQNNKISPEDSGIL